MHRRCHSVPLELSSVSCSNITGVKSTWEYALTNHRIACHKTLLSRVFLDFIRENYLLAGPYRHRCCHSLSLGSVKYDASLALPPEIIAVAPVPNLLLAGP